VAEGEDVPLASAGLGDLTARRAALSPGRADFDSLALATLPPALVRTALLAIAKGFALFRGDARKLLSQVAVAAHQSGFSVADFLLKHTPLAPQERIPFASAFSGDVVTTGVHNALPAQADQALFAAAALPATPVRPALLTFAGGFAALQNTGEVRRTILVVFAIPAKSPASIVTAFLTIALRDTELDADSRLAQEPVLAVAAHFATPVVSALLTIALGFAPILA